MDVQVSVPLAFLAGLVSFLSPCVLPVVPSYVAFVSGVSLDELTDRTVRGARRSAAIHSTLFFLGFGLVFMTMGLVATAVGPPIARALPWINRLGGIALATFGLYLTGLLRAPALAREYRLRFASRPAGTLGSFAVGVAFGAGWTPCIGPILGSILLYASLESTMTTGTVLLGTYAAGLGVPFIVTSLAFNWFLLGSARVKQWLVPVQRIAGTLLIVVGLLMVTGRFASLTSFLADLGQLINLELS